MASQVRLQFGDDHHVIGPGLDDRCAARTDVALASCVRLDGQDSLIHPKKPHPRASAIRTSAPTTMAMSAVEVRVFRNGLKPMTNGSVGL